MRWILTAHFDAWTPWFAWYPVTIGGTRVWRETVERRLKMYGYDPVWEHRYPR